MSLGNDREFIDYLESKEKGGRAMECPRRKRYVSNDHGGWDEEFLPCYGTMCAWWQPEIGNCIIYQLGMEIGTLCLFLEEIKDKMPHEVQFRK